MEAVIQTTSSFRWKNPWLRSHFLAHFSALGQSFERIEHCFSIENSRIHIDSVKGLGEFVEFEVVVNRGKAQARKLMQSLMRVFEIETKSLIAGSYSDMPLRKK